MELGSFNKKSRPQILQQLSSELFDLIAIGGGITGASIFRDAALRGMRVALIESNDFAAGTSGRSSKLIHGGLRYLKDLKFRLVWESCHERNLQTQLNRRLVHSLPFLVPIYSGQGDSRARLRVGMWMYEVMSGFKNFRPHRSLSRAETLSIAPGLRSEALTGGVLYYDAAVDDIRWTLETVKDGVRHGGIAINHAPVTDLLKETTSITGVTFRDRIGNRAHEARARVVVNATGAWADHIRKLDMAETGNLAGLSRGTHLVFRLADMPLMVSTVFLSPIDRRPLYLVKREGCFLYGTTDDWVESNPDAPVPFRQDVEYLFESLRRFMPALNVGRGQVQYVYSGFRALPVTGNGNLDSSSATREDLIEVAPSGLITVVGGKLSTARLMAIRVLERAIRGIGKSGARLPCQTDKLPIGGSNDEIAEGLAHWVRLYPQLAKYFRSLYQRYGLDAHQICAETAKTFSPENPQKTSESFRPEVQYVCRNEMACTVEDLMERRVGFLHWSNSERLHVLKTVERVVCDELNMSQKEFEESYRDYHRHLEKLHTLP